MENYLFILIYVLLNFCMFNILLPLAHSCQSFESIPITSNKSWRKKWQLLNLLKSAKKSSNWSILLPYFTRRLTVRELGCVKLKECREENTWWQDLCSWSCWGFSTWRNYQSHHLLQVAVSTFIGQEKPFIVQTIFLELM